MRWPVASVIIAVLAALVTTYVASLKYQPKKEN